MSGSEGTDQQRAPSFHAGLALTAPDLARRLARADATSPVRGALDLPNQLRPTGRPGWALVGDAGHDRDPVTGHGITDAFRDAELLADCSHHAPPGAPEAAALARYHRERDEQLRRRSSSPPCRWPRTRRRTSWSISRSSSAGALDREAEHLAARPLPGSVLVEAGSPHAG